MSKKKMKDYQKLFNRIYEGLGVAYKILSNVFLICLVIDKDMFIGVTLLTLFFLLLISSCVYNGDEND